MPNKKLLLCKCQECENVLDRHMAETTEQVKKLTVNDGDWLILQGEHSEPFVGSLMRDLQAHGKSVSIMVLPEGKTIDTMTAEEMESILIARGVKVPNGDQG